MLARFTCFIMAVAVSGAAAESLSISAPVDTVVGSGVTVSFKEETNPRNFVTIVPAGSQEGIYKAYRYARGKSVALVAPVTPGEYEIRLLQAERPFATLWRQPLSVADAVATVGAPEQVDGGAEFEVAWTGPDNAQDFITIVPAGTPEGKYERGYRYTRSGSPLEIRAPESAGSYEIRYLMGAAPHRTLGRRALTVAGVSASLNVPATVHAGAHFTVSWEGPNNHQDFLTIVPRGTTEKEFGDYAYTKAGNPASLPAPDDHGDYEIRYLTGQNYTVLARAPVQVLPVTASVSAAATVETRSVVTVSWEGPDNPQDYVIILPVGADNNSSGHFAYTSRGPQLRIQTPDEPGDYEIRYLTGRKHRTLATRPLEVIPRPIPGRLEVVSTDTRSGIAADAAVIVVLDASGSMLQRIGDRRRIDIAREAVMQLVETDLAPEVQFSLRVFGHKEKDSCRTDLEIPLGPLNRSSATATIASINAMNLAKTPIAATLAAAGGDLRTVSGPKLLILLTDGEETCGGDPEAVIRSLAAEGTDLRVNIVGFAIDELMLRESFQAWARLGNGQYFDARGAADLATGLSQALEVPFQVLDESRKIIGSGIVNGPPIELAAGNYTVVTTISASPNSVRIKGDELSVVTLQPPE